MSDFETKMSFDPVRTVEPGLAPGRYWRKVLGPAGETVTEGMVDLDSAKNMAENDAYAALERPGTSVHFYDGDSGRLVLSLRT